MDPERMTTDDSGDGSRARDAAAHDPADHSRSLSPSGMLGAQWLVSTLSEIVLLILLPCFKPFQAEDQQGGAQDRKNKPTDEKDEIINRYQIEQRSEQVHFAPSLPSVSRVVMAGGWCLGSRRLRRTLRAE
jgi:hypothetical protein